MADVMRLNVIQRDDWPDVIKMQLHGEFRNYVPERTCKAELMPKNRELRMAPWLECSECGAELSAYGTDKYCHGCGARVVSE